MEVAGTERGSKRWLTRRSGNPEEGLGLNSPIGIADLEQWASGDRKVEGQKAQVRS